MGEEIRPGSRIRVKVVRVPKKAAAAKTLMRLLRKDAAVRREDERLRKVRKAKFRQKWRGGRLWDIHQPAIPPVRLRVGVEGVMLASADVLRDLRSVSRFVEVQLA